MYLAVSHSSPKKSEIPTTKIPEPFEKPLHRVMGAVRGILVRLGVLDLELVKMVASALFEGLSKGAK